MKTCAFIILGSLLLTQATHAEKMLNDCEINEWEDTNGTLAYYQVVSQGKTVYWLKQAEYGTYANAGDVDENGIITNSDAVKVCAKKGLLLPTKEDLEALWKCFDTYKSDARSLTIKGLLELHKKFPDMVSRDFWLASVNPKDQRNAFHFAGFFGRLFDKGLRTSQAPVRCISRL